MKDKRMDASSTTALMYGQTDQVSWLQRCLWLLNTFYYQVLAIVTMVMFWIFFEVYSLQATRLWHLVLTTAAYVPLMAAAIILFSEDNITTLHISRTKRYTIHGVLLFISCLAVTAGISVETDAKRRAGRSHFQSDHAILGLVSWILMFLSVLIGLMAANTRTFSSYIKPVVIKLIHNVLGLAAFAIGIGSLFEMLSFFERNSSKSIYTGIYVFLVFVTIWSGLAALKSLYRQVKGAFF